MAQFVEETSQNGNSKRQRLEISGNDFKLVITYPDTKAIEDEDIEDKYIEDEAANDEKASKERKMKSTKDFLTNQLLKNYKVTNICR